MKLNREIHEGITLKKGGGKPCKMVEKMPKNAKWWKKRQKM